MQSAFLRVSQQPPHWPQEAAQGLFRMGGPPWALVSSSVKCGDEKRQHTGPLSLGSVGRPLLGRSQAGVLTSEPKFPCL